jgi:hypothetical protein
MNFCYAKLSKYDLMAFRLGGPGLGNLLFPWARALLYSKNNGCKLIFPTWPQIKIGPILRGEIDKRNYFRLFKPVDDELRGFKKVITLLSLPRKSEHDAATSQDQQVIEFKEMSGFDALYGNSTYLRESLIDRLVCNRIAELQFACQSSASIAVHVRFGDFMDQKACSVGACNTRQPIDWYVSVVKALRQCIKSNIRVNIFSDASDLELSPLLELENSMRVHGNNAIEDILIIGGHKALVASGSTFSMWSSFLGQIPTVWYPGQKKHNLLENKQLEIEYQQGDCLKDFCLSIK